MIGQGELRTPHGREHKRKRVSFGCERSCSSVRRVSNFNSKVTQGGIYLHIKFERDRLNIFRVRVSTCLGGRGRGDAKTIISPNTSFGDITICPPSGAHNNLLYIVDYRFYHTY